MSRSDESWQTKVADPDFERPFSLAERLRSALGSVLLFSGIALLSLLVADRTAGLPVRLPRSWYSDRALWVAVGLLSFGAGWYLLGDPKPSKDGSPAGKMADGPPAPGLRFERVVLYTRAGCHLCDLARETLEKYRDSLPPPTEIDIEIDPAHFARFSTCIPVVEMDGKIRFRGRINEILLRRLILATPPKRLETLADPG